MIMRLVRGLLWAAKKAEEHERLLQLHNEQTKFVTLVLDLKRDKVASRDYGPWRLRIPYRLEATIDNDYILVGGGPSTHTLRQRLALIDSIVEVSTAPNVTEFALESAG